MTTFGMQRARIWLLLGLVLLSIPAHEAGFSHSKAPITTDDWIRSLRHNTENVEHSESYERDIMLRIAASADEINIYEEYDIKTEKGSRKDDSNMMDPQRLRSCVKTGVTLAKTLKDYTPVSNNFGFDFESIESMTKDAFREGKVVAYHFDGLGGDHFMTAACSGDSVTIAQGWQHITHLSVHTMKVEDYDNAMKDLFSGVTEEERMKGLKKLVPKTITDKVTVRIPVKASMKTIYSGKPSKLIISSREDALKVISQRGGIICPRSGNRRGKRDTSSRSTCPSEIGRAITNSGLIQKESRFMASLNKEMSQVNTVTNAVGTISNIDRWKNVKKIGKMFRKLTNALDTFFVYFSVVNIVIDLIGGGGDSAELSYMKLQFAQVHRKLDNLGLQIHKIKDLVEFSNNAAALIDYEKAIVACYKKYIKVSEQLQQSRQEGRDFDQKDKILIESLVNFMENEGLEGALNGLFLALTKGFQVTEGKKLMSLLAAKLQNNCPEILAYGSSIINTMIYGVKALKFKNLFRQTLSAFEDPWVKQLKVVNLNIFSDFAECTRNAKDYGSADLKLVVDENQSIDSLTKVLTEKFVVYKWAVILCESSETVDIWHYAKAEISNKNYNTKKAAYAVYLPLSLDNDRSKPIIQQKIHEFCQSTRPSETDEFSSFFDGLVVKMGNHSSYIGAVARVSYFLDDSSFQGWDIIYRYHSGCLRSTITRSGSVCTLSHEFKILIMLKKPASEVDPCSSCQYGKCLLLTDVKSEGNETYCHCIEGYSGDDCNEKLDQPIINDTFVQSMNEALKEMRLPSFYDLADRMDEINKNINISRRDSVLHMDRMSETIVRNINGSILAIETTSRTEMDHVSIVGTKVAKTIEETRDQIMNDLNKQSSHVENKITYIGSIFNISIHSLRESFIHLMTDLKKDIISQAEIAKEEVMSTIIESAFDFQTLHKEVIATIHQAKYYSYQTTLKHWINEYKRIKKGSNAVTFDHFVNNLLCNMHKLREAREVLKDMLAGPSNTVLYLMDVLTYPKCQEDYHKALKSYRTGLVDQFAASYSLLVWALERSISIEDVRCPPHITIKDINVIQDGFITDIKTFWFHASCPAFKNEEITGGGCELYATKPGLKVNLACRAKINGKAYTPVLSTSQQSVQTIICQSNYQWNHDPNKIVCVEPCQDEKKDLYFVGGVNKTLNAMVGFQYVDQDQKKMDHVPCIAVRTSNSIVSKFKFDVQLVDVDECTKSPCKHGICINTYGSYHCTCFNGFTKDHSMACTQDIDECSLPNSCKNGQCYNTLGSYYCRCNAHYTYDNASVSCKPQRYCTVENNNGGCEQICKENVGAMNGCECMVGFTSNKRNTSACNDVNECAKPGNCPENEQCKNHNGYHTCHECPSGYQGNSQTCTDMNECLMANDCDLNAKCINTEGSYICHCNPGFTGDGKSCWMDGNWSSWRVWSSWTATCGSASRFRERFCNNPSPKYGGQECSGQNQEEERQRFPECPQCTSNSGCRSDEECIDHKCYGVCCFNKCDQWYEICQNGPAAHHHKCSNWFGYCRGDLYREGAVIYDAMTTYTLYAYGYHCVRRASVNHRSKKCFCYGNDYHTSGWGVWGCGTTRNSYCYLARSYRKPTAGSTTNCPTRRKRLAILPPLP